MCAVTYNLAVATLQHGIALTHAPRPSSCSFEPKTSPRSNRRLAETRSARWRLDDQEAIAVDIAEEELRWHGIPDADLERNKPRPALPFARDAFHRNAPSTQGGVIRLDVLRGKGAISLVAALIRVVFAASVILRSFVCFGSARRHAKEEPGSHKNACSSTWAWSLNAAASFFCRA